MILGFLSEKPMCGYELRKKMEQLQGYARTFSDGAVYPATKRMVESGLIAQRDEVRDGRQRREFSLLDAGRSRLVETLRDAHGFNITDSNRWSVILTFLSIVPDPDDRDAVLRRRYDYLNETSIHFFYCDSGRALEAQEIDDPYRRGIIALHDQQVVAEIRWLESMLGSGVSSQGGKKESKDVGDC